MADNVEMQGIEFQIVNLCLGAFLANCVHCTPYLIYMC